MLSRIGTILTIADRAGKLDPASSRIHYLRGQTLIHIGRKAEGKKEIDTSVRMSSAIGDNESWRMTRFPAPN